MTNEYKQHWETIYQTKQPDEVSWTQEIPQTSLDFIHSLKLPKSAAIIDIGGGDSKLVDFLLEEGYENLTVLDISASALERAKNRLGKRAEKVNWVVSDITEFKPDRSYDIWHDRAAFHFLTDNKQIARYIDLVKHNVKGFMLIGTFSDNGPKKCSGLEVRQYSSVALKNMFEDDFTAISCKTEDHRTPFNTTQNFTFCSFKRNE